MGMGPCPLGPNSSSTWMSSCRGAALLLLLAAPGTPKLLSSSALLRCWDPVPLRAGGAHRDAAPAPAAGRLLPPRLLGAANAAGLTPRATEAGCCCGIPIAVLPCRDRAQADGQMAAARAHAADACEACNHGPDVHATVSKMSVCVAARQFCCSRKLRPRQGATHLHALLLDRGPILVQLWRHVHWNQGCERGPCCGGVCDCWPHA